MAEFDILRLDRGIIEGDITRVKSALDNGTSPDGDKNAGKKPIHFAVENDSIQIVELLCEWGAKVNVPNPEEQDGSPLHMAVKKGFTSVVKCLLEKNADPNVKDGEGDTPLITAIRKGEISSAGLLLKYGADLKKRDKIHDSALHIAVKKNNGEIVQMLLKEGASVNNINMQGDFTIHVAARNASEWILETLKEKRCDINQRHRDGSSPLHLAAESGNLEAVKWLLRNGAKLDDLDAGGKTPTDRAADAKKTHVVDWIKDSKLVDREIRTPNKRDEIRQNAEKGKQSHLKSNFKLGVPNEEEDAKGNRKPQAHVASRCAAEDAQHPSLLRQGAQGVPDDQLPKVHGGTSGGVVPTKSTTTITTNVESEILRASREGNVEKVKRLIQRNTDLEVTDKKGQRPLHLAALEGHDAVVKELLSGGADVAAKGPEGLSTIHYAAKGGHVSTLFTLLESQCDIEALTEDGSTALHLAALNGHSTVVEWLVKQARLKVTLANKKRETALDLARKAGKEDVIQFLVKECTKEALKSGDVEGLRDLARRGVDVDAVGFRKGLRPAHMAAMHGHINLLKNLREIRCDVKAETDKGLTALHIAAHYNHLEAVRWLVEEAGLEVSHRSKDGHTALDYAEGRRYEDITTYLKQVIQKKGARKVKSGEAEGNRMTETGAASGGGEGGGGRRGGGAEEAGGGGPTMTLRSAKTSKLLMLARTGDATGVRQLADEGVDLEAMSSDLGEAGLRALHLASRAGHAAVVQELIKGGADINAKTTQGLCAIHYAAKGGHNEVIGILKEMKCDLNAVTGEGDTALHYAALHSNLQTVMCLVHNGVDFALRNRKGLTPLDMAVTVGKENMKNYLITVVMERSFASHDTKTLVELLKKGADLHTPILQEEGKRAVHYAAYHGSLEMLQLLKERNVDMASPSPDGDTALHRAVAGDQTEAVRWLLSEGGLDVACRSKDGQTALDRAMELRKTYMADYLQKVAVERAMASGDTKTLVELLRKGVDIDHLIYLQSKDGIRAVHFAAFHGSLVMLQLLKERNVDMASTSLKGHTALHWAVMGDHFEAVRWLLSEGGLDVARRSSDGKTAFDMAKSQGKTSIANYLQKKTHEAEDARKARGRHEPLQGKETQKYGQEESQQLNERLLKEAEGGNLEAVKALLDKGADVEVASTARGAEKGLRPLHLATWGGHASVVRELLLRGADKTARGPNGYSLVHFAAKRGSVEVLEILREAKCNMKAKTDDSQTALHVAADHGNQAAVQWLVENVAIELNCRNRDGDKALNLAQKSGHKSIADYLLMVMQGENTRAGAATARKTAGARTAAASRGTGVAAGAETAATGGTAAVARGRVTRSGTAAVARGTGAETSVTGGTAVVARGTGAETAATGGTAAVARGTGAVARTGAGTAAADAARGTGAAAGAETAAVGGRPAETARNGIGAETGGQGITMELRTLEEYRNCVDRAMASDDFKSLIELMEKGIDVDTLIYESNDQGIRAVHYAAKNGEMEMLETLKDKNFDLKALTRKGFTALHCAVLTGQLDAVQWLVSEAGLDVASPSKGGETALDLANVLNRDDIGNYLMQIQGQKAFQEDDVNAMRALLGKGFNVNTILREKENKECRPLHLAAARGHTTIVNILLQNEADINTKNYEGMTPLHLASLAGNEEVIKALVEKGADWNTETTDGMMAIHLASIGGHVSAMEALAPVCDIASVTRDGKSALHLAAEHGNLAAVQWLTRIGLDLSLKDHSGRTSLQYAKNEGQKKVVEFLENFEKYHSPQNLTQAVTSGDVDAVRKILLYKVDLERPSPLNQENDRRVLHTAALFGHVDIIRELLKAGAAKDARDRMGLQAVHYAAKGGNIEALKLLKECQCDLTTRTIKGDMVLHYATEGGHLAAVQWLCEHAGLGLNTLNNSGETALDVARRKGDINTALYLQNAKHQRELQELQNELKNKDAEIAELKRKM